MNRRINVLLVVTLVLGLVSFLRASPPSRPTNDVVLSPAALELTLVADASQTVTFSATVPPRLAQPVDLYFLVDTSRGSSVELAYLRSQVKEIMEGVREAGPIVRFGLGEFSDYPMSPFGSTPDVDTAYRQVIALTADEQAVLRGLDRLRPRPGGDAAQSQLVALYQAATGAGQDLNGNGSFAEPGDILPNQQANFAPEARRFIILITGSPFHGAMDRQEVSYPFPLTVAEVCRVLNQERIKVIGISLGPQATDSLQTIATDTQTFVPLGGVDVNDDGLLDSPETAQRVDLLAGEPFVGSTWIPGRRLGQALLRLGDVSLVAVDNPETSSFDETTLVHIDPTNVDSGAVDLSAGGTFEFEVTFTAPREGEAVGRDFTVPLRLRIGHGFFGQATVTLTTKQPAPPTCQVTATPGVMVNAGETVTLTGMASDPDGVDNLNTLEWGQTSGPMVTLMEVQRTADTLTVSFTAPACTVTLEFVFRVTDDDGLTAECPVTVNVADVTPPTVTITAPAVDECFLSTTTSLTVTGTAADDCGVASVQVTATQPGGMPVTAMCTVTNGAFSCTLVGLVGGPVTLSVQATDLAGNMSVPAAPDSMRDVRINRRPTAQIAAVTPKLETCPFLLDGTGSTDPDGDPLTFSFQQVNPAAQFPFGLTGATTAMPTVTPPRLTLSDPFCITATFQLIVTDTCGSINEASDPVTVTVQVQNVLVLRDNRNNGNTVAINLCTNQYSFTSPRFASLSGSVRLMQGQGDGNQWHIFDANNPTALSVNVDVRRLVGTAVLLVRGHPVGIFDGNVENNAIPCP